MKTIYKLPITLASLILLIAYFYSDPSFYNGAFHKSTALTICMCLWVGLTNYVLYLPTKFGPWVTWTAGTAVLLLASAIF